MVDPRVRRLGEVLLQHSLRVQPGERIFLETFDIPPEVTACLVEMIAAAGAQPLVETRQNQVLAALYAAATESQMRLIGELELQRMGKVDGYIGLRGGANSSELSGVPEDRMSLHRRHVWKPVHIEQRCSHTRWVVLRWPAPAFAQSAGMSTRDFEDFYFRACCLDYGRMEEAVAPLQRRMAAANEIRLTAPGTDLVMEKGEIDAVPCTGRRNVPDGECFTAPLRDRVNGTIRFNTSTTYGGKVFDDVALELRDGRIVHASASDSAGLNRILDSDEGARYIGEVSLGFHPHILHPMRDTLFDEKIAGSLHFTPGAAYEVADNGNRSEVHWDMVLIQRPEYGGGEVYFDGELIRRDGLFLPDDLKPLNPENLGA